MNSIRFACTSLLGTNKVGELKKDADGYYEMVVGGLNVFNSGGQYYDYEGAKMLFEGSSQLMRRVKRGVLRGEYGHPKQGSLNDRAFAVRALSIYEDRTCCHHAEIWLDFNRIKDENGRPIIAIMSKVAPSGELGHVLERQLNNKRENVCFSVRSFSDESIDRFTGVVRRVMKNIVTFDFVNEPGISAAEKFKSPALESFDEKVFGRADIEQGIMEAEVAGLSMESVTMSAQELFQSMGWQPTPELISRFNTVSPWQGW